LVILLTGMSSCTKTEVVNNNNWQIVDCSISYSQWRYLGDDTRVQYNNNYYYAGYNLSQLTQDIFKDGNVQVYMVEKSKATGEEMQRPLPFTKHFETWNGDTTLFHTETYDYFYGVGWIEFNYTASDFAYEDSRGTEYRPGIDEYGNPIDTQFRIVFTW